MSRFDLNLLIVLPKYML